jgi:hypothetical protein
LPPIAWPSAFSASFCSFFYTRISVPDCGAAIRVLLTIDHIFNILTWGAQGGLYGMRRWRGNWMKKQDITHESSVLAEVYLKRGVEEQTAL